MWVENNLGELESKEVTQADLLEKGLFPQKAKAHILEKNKAGYFIVPFNKERLNVVSLYIQHLEKRCELYLNL